MKKIEILILVLILFSVSIANVSADDKITSDNTTLDALQEDTELLQDDTITNLSEEVSESQIADEISVEFEEVMWSENLTDIKVDFPENAIGEFCLKIDNEVIYIENITEKSIKIPVKIPPRNWFIVSYIWPPADAEYHTVSAFYNDIDLNIAKMLKVIKNPSDAVKIYSFPDEILQYNDYNLLRYTLIIPRSATGEIEVYVDGRKITAKNNAPFIEFDTSEISNLSLGNHTIDFRYLGDDYYKPRNSTFDFNVTNVVIDVPQTINIGHDDTVSVEVLKNTSGVVDVYLDNVRVYTGKITKGEFILSLENYLKHNTSEVKVVFTGKHYGRTKTVPVNVTYDFEVWQSDFIYGSGDVLEVYLPDRLNNSLLNVSINGVEYSFVRSHYITNNMIEIDISKLIQGNYTLFISYPGDVRFAHLNRTYNLTVSYDFTFPDFVEYADGSEISLKLPGNASGKFSVYIDGKLFKSVKMNKGFAKIRVDDLSPGHYNINMSYDGEDYDVSYQYFEMIVFPKISLDYKIVKGTNSFITFKVPSSCKGYVIFKINQKDYKTVIKNGIAKLNLKNFKNGEYDVEIEYYGSDGYNSSYYQTFTVYSPDIDIVSAKIYSTGVKIKIAVINDDYEPLSNHPVSFTLNGKTYHTKTNSKGVAVLKKSLNLKVKKYKLTVQIGKTKKSKTVKARHSLSLKTVRIKKSQKKLVLKATLKEGNAPLKYKYITFKFKGKKYLAKTNKKGIAKVIIKKSVLKKLKLGKKINYKAIYHKDICRKTVKVRK